MTYTYVTMDVSPAAYEEIKQKLLDAGYHQALHDREGRNGFPALDMHGIAITCQPEPKPTPHASSSNRKKLRAGKPTL